MKKKTQSRILLGSLAIGTALGAMLLASPESHADGVMSARELLYAQAIGEDFVCHSWRTDGMTPVNLAATTNAIAVVGGFDADDAGDIVRYSTLTYCPSYSPALERIVDWAIHANGARQYA